MIMFLEEFFSLFVASNFGYEMSLLIPHFWDF